MPIIDLGYRRWEGTRSGHWMRPWVVTMTGLRLVWRAVWLRRLLIVVWLPALPAGLAFFLYEQSVNEPELQRALTGFISHGLERPDLAAQLLANPDEARHDVWALFMFTFFRYPQAMMIVILFGLVAPRMISYDMRSRAHLIYFSKPLTVTEYLVGKAMVLAILMVLTATLPALGVYVVGLLLSPDTTVIFKTYDLPFRILVSSAVLAIPTASLALMYSSFTTESRYASFAWFATWALGWVTYATLTSSDLISQGALVSVSPNLKLVSLYHALGEIQGAVFGVLPDAAEALPALLLVGVLTFFAILVTYQRVASQIRV